MRTPCIPLILARNAVVSGVLILSLHNGTVCGQKKLSQNTPQKPYPVVSWETYNRVLDIIFPREDPDTSKTIFEFVLRFEPSFHSTSQIVIRNRGDKTEVIEYTSPDGNIFGKLNEILERSHKEDPGKMSKSIRVTRRELVLPNAQSKEWLNGFFENLAPTEKILNQKAAQEINTGSVTLVLDGTTYNLWYKHGLNKISLGLYDVEIDTPGFEGELKLVQWMNRIRREVTKSK